MHSTSLLTVGIVLVIVTMTFGALVAVFLIRSQALVDWGHLKLPRILWATTAILMLSSWTLEQGRNRLVRNMQAEAHRMFRWTAFLGLGFLCGQIIAWLQVLSSGAISAGRDAHPWFLFLFTGLHGVHILLGMAGVIYLYVRTGTVVSGPRYLMKTRVLTTGISIFWHYLDGLWIVLFGLLLFWRT